MTTRLLRLAAPSLASTLLLAWGCAATPTADPATRAEVLERERAWADAMAAHDHAALEDILAAEFRLTWVDLIPGRPGKPELPREGWLANLASMTFGPIEMRDQRVTMQGPNVAVVRMDMTLHDWKWGDETIPADYELTDIWVRRDARWQVVNRISEPDDED